MSRYDYSYDRNDYKSDDTPRNNMRGAEDRPYNNTNPYGSDSPLLDDTFDPEHEDARAYNRYFRDVERTTGRRENGNADASRANRSPRRQRTDYPDTSGNPASQETRRAPRTEYAEEPSANQAAKEHRQRAKVAVKKERRPISEWGIVKFFADKRLHAIVGVALVFVAVYIAVAAISFLRNGYEDQSVVTSGSLANIIASGAEVDNAAGPVGAKLAQSVIVDGLGLGSVALIVYLVLVGISLMGLRKTSFWSVTFKSLLVGITLSLVFGLIGLWTASGMFLGGEHGLQINIWLVKNTDWIGASLVSLFAIVSVFYVYINDLTRLYNRYSALRRARREKAEQRRLELEEDHRRVRQAMEQSDNEIDSDASHHNQHHETAESDCTDDPTPIAVGFDDLNATDIEQSDDPYAITTPADSPSFGHQHLAAAQHTPANEALPDNEASPDTSDNISTSNVAPDCETTQAPKPASTTDVIPASETIDVIKAPSIEAALDEGPELYDPTAELSHYEKPYIDLLRDLPVKENNVDIVEQEENQARIRKTLNDFGIEISKIKATVGPTVTLYEIIPAEGVRIAKIKRLEDDIALQLAALGIRIIAPMPGKGTIGIEVPNKDPQTVSIRSILSSKRFIEGKEQLPMAMGATISNEVFVADLCKMPHLLVAGATGMGKSVGLNTIIASLLYKRHPAELKFVLIDPKMVEFSLYSVLEKHFLAKLPDETEAVVTDANKVIPTLTSLCVEMENRLALLRDANVRSIAEYNDKFVQKHLLPTKGHRFLPYIVVIVDEFADLMMVAGKEVEKPVARIAQKARAVGIHMIVATQRPSTDVITGLIKNNFPGRIAFRVTQMVDSKTILDRPGANQLIGRGDMLFMHNGALTRVQCAFIDTPEVQAICEHIAQQIGYPSAYELPDPALYGDAGGTATGGATSGGSGNNYGERDTLFNEVAEAVVQAGFGSTSSVQRRFGVGFARAGKIMDQLEAAGIVGPATGGKPRQVLVDIMGLQDILHTLE